MRVGSLRPALLSLAVLASLAFFLTCSTSSPQPMAGSRYGEIPLVFEQNQGQTDPRVQFLARTSTHTLFLAGNEMVVRAPGSKGAAKDAARIQFRGANANVVPVARERITGAFNYFIGNDPSKWRTNVPGYQRVEYRQFYPGIDLVCYGQGQQLEYDFVVAPGARPQDIRLSVEGEIANGDLLLKNSARMKKPVAYQMSGGSRRLVAASYARRANGEFGFDIGAYDATQPLVIDPVLAYSTFLGGSNFDDTGTAIAVDSAGSAYVTGYSSSVDFPTVPPFENAFGGGLNVFVTKFTPQGNGIVYSTTVGGLSFDQGFGIAIDGSGNAYVTGVTFSNNFPIVGGFQSQLGMFRDTFGNSSATQDAFVFKLNATGNALVYSSYLGGSNTDQGRAIAVDASGQAYFTGSTNSQDFPVRNAFQAAKGDTGSGQDAFIAKVNAAGNALVYATFLGGSSDDNALGIAVDGSGNAYVAGNTSSVNFPTLNPFQALRGGNATSFNNDVFVTKINAAGSQLVYSTYVGGSTNDTAAAIAVDSQGAAYVTGFTNSREFPLVPLQALTGTAFAFKLNPAGSALLYSKLFGGNGTDTPGAIAVDNGGNAYVAGRTSSSNFPVVNGLQRLPSQSFFQVGFVTKIDATGSTLLYSTPLGTGSESINGIAVDAAGAAYVAGTTNSANFPTVNAFQPTFGGGGADAFVAKIGEGSQPAPLVFTGGIVNAASFRPATDVNGAVAPGAIVAIFGNNLSQGSQSASTLPLPTTLFDTSVTFNGVPAPLFYVSGIQINAQVPFETPTGSVTVRVTRGDQAVATQNVNVATVSPGVFFAVSGGANVGAVLHARNFAFVTSQDPAVAGEFISIYATGLGPLTQPVPSGTIPPSPPPMTVTPATITIGGSAATVSYTGLAARFAGLYQVNAIVPTGLSPGPQPLVVSINGIPSNTVVVWVK